jgi:SAM-dependent methyltransferase
VDDVIVQRLLDLNRQFYQTFALHFSATRQRLQPGVLRVLPTIQLGDQILDLGCGNGELAKELAARDFHGHYLGLDQTTEFLAEARRKLANRPNFSFSLADLVSPTWHQDFSNLSFDVILALAILHHIPGDPLRRQILSAARRLLRPAGHFIHSEWQFLNSSRLRDRLQPLEQVGVNANQLDRGDYLLDWRASGQGLRYVHYFSAEELASLADETGFVICETFRSDGEGGKLGLYQIWKRV